MKTAPIAPNADLLQNCDEVLHCPYCRSASIRNSHVRHPLDILFLLLLHRPLRCRACDYRFRHWLWVKVPKRSGH